MLLRATRLGGRSAAALVLARPTPLLARPLSLPLAAPLAASLRWLSAASAPPPPPPGGPPPPSPPPPPRTYLSLVRRYVTLANIRAHWPQLLAGTGVLVVLYGISSAAVHVATALLSLDLKQVFYFGFLSGVGTSAALALLALRTYRRNTIRPELVHRAALLLLQRNAAVRAELGGQLRSGHLKAYEVHDAHFGVERFGWVEPRVQMIFQVVGDKGEGMASCEAVNHNGSLQFTLVTLDTPDEGTRRGKLLLVVGKEEKLHVRGTLRGFLQSERAQYVAQDKVEKDEDRLSEQKALPEVSLKEEEEALAEADARLR